MSSLSLSNLSTSAPSSIPKRSPSSSACGSCWTVWTVSTCSLLSDCMQDKTTVIIPLTKPSFNYNSYLQVTLLYEREVGLMNISTTQVCCLGKKHTHTSHAYASSPMYTRLKSIRLICAISFHPNSLSKVLN